MIDYLLLLESNKWNRLNKKRVLKILSFLCSGGVKEGGSRDRNFRDGCKEFGLLINRTNFYNKAINLSCKRLKVKCFKDLKFSELGKKWHFQKKRFI